MENITPKSSPFMSMFGRKKRVNGTKSSDDIKGTAAALSVSNGQTVANGFIDSDIDSLKDFSIQNGQTQQARNITNDIGTIRHPTTGGITPSNSTFIDKVRYHKSSRTKYNKELDNNINNLDNNLPSQSNTLPNRANSDKRKRSEQITENNKQKSKSVDAIYVNSSPEYLMEALETLGEEQPLVARSIPKHAVVDTTYFIERSLENCLFDSSVYDNMLCNSLKVCEMLQNHLTECIETVRSKSPEIRQLEHGTETEDESEATYGSSSQQTIIESRIANNDSKRLSTLTNDTYASSNEGKFDSIKYPNDINNRKLKSIVQYQC